MLTHDKLGPVYAPDFDPAVKTYRDETNHGDCQCSGAGGFDKPFLVSDQNHWHSFADRLCHNRTKCSETCSFDEVKP